MKKMKTSKIILSFVLTFVMIMSIMPTAFASQITITGLDTAVNLTKPVTFYTTIPAGFEEATVSIDDVVAKTITENASFTFYRVTLNASDFKTAGTHTVKISAGDMNVSKTVECYYPSHCTEVINTSMSGLADLTKDDGLTKSEAAKATGFYAVESQNANTGVTISRKGGLGSKEATDYALAFVGKTGNTKTNASYVRQNPASAINSGIVEYDFSFYRHGSTIRHLAISGPVTSNYGYISLNNHVKQSDVWYHIRFLMNLTEKTYEFEVDNGGGVLSSGSGVLDKADMTMSAFYIQMSPANDDAAFVAIDDFSINAYTPSDKQVQIISHSDNEEVSGGSSFDVKAEAFNSDSVTLYVDGEEKETKQSDGSGSYTFAIDANGTGFGLKDIRIVAFDGNTPIGADSVNINRIGTLDSNLSTAVNGNFQDFNTMENVSGVSDSASLDSFRNAFGWKINVNASNQLTLTRTAGHTGKSGDYAPLFQYPSVSAANGNNYRVELYGANPNEEAAGGRLIYDFWIKTNTKDILRLASVPFWHDTMYFLSSGGKLVGTDYTLTPGTWYHFNMVLDRDAADENGKGLWYVKVNDTLVVDGVRQGSNQYMTGGNVMFILTHNTASSTTAAGIALDDVRIYVERDVPSIEKTTYTANGEAVDATNTIPSSAKSVSLTLSDALAVTDSDVELYIDGESATHGGVNVADKIVTVNLPELSASSDIKLVLKNSIEGLAADLSAFFNVTDESGFYAKLADSGISESEAGAVVHFITPSDIDAKAIVATYTGNAMTSVSVKPVSVKNGDSYVSVLKKYLPEYENVKIMLWNADVKPVIEAVSNSDLTVRYR